MGASTVSQQFAQIRSEVEAEGGIKEFTLGQLRDALGYGKLGIYVIQEISSKLDEYGMRTLPVDLTSVARYQDQQVRVFDNRSQLGRLIHAVVSPSPQGDQLLRSAAANDQAAVLSQIRALVCD